MNCMDAILFKCCFFCVPLFSVKEGDGDKASALRMVFTSDVIRVRVVSGVVRALMT